mgnify:CR=1 FL=1
MRLRVEMSEWSEKDVHVLHDVLMPPKNDTLVHVHMYVHVCLVHTNARMSKDQQDAMCMATLAFTQLRQILFYFNTN